MLLNNYAITNANQTRGLGGNLDPTYNFSLSRMNTFYVGDTSSLAPFVTNLVKNGDFEFAPPFAAATNIDNRWIDGTAGGSTLTTSPYIWAIVAGSRVASSTASFDTTVKYSGGASLKIDATDATGTLVVSTYRVSIATAATELIPCLPSTTYTLSAKVKTSSVAANAAHIRLRTVDSSLVTVSTNISNRLSGTNDWTTCTVTYTTEPTAVYIAPMLTLDAGQAGTAWFDDISLTLTNQVTRSSTDNNNQYASQPQFGLQPPYSLVLPPKAGGMSMSNTRGTGALSAGGFAGLGGTVTMAGTGVLEATGGLLAGLEVTMAGSGDLTAIGGGLLEAIVSMAGSGTLAGALSATAGMTVEMAGVGTVSFAPSGTGEMEVIIYVNQSQATVDQIVTGVTDSLGSITATVPNLLNTETGDVIIPLD
jgi:hypothetical protein